MVGVALATDLAIPVMGPAIRAMDAAAADPGGVVQAMVQAGRVTAEADPAMAGAGQVTEGVDGAASNWSLAIGTGRSHSGPLPALARAGEDLVRLLSFQRRDQERCCR